LTLPAASVNFSAVTPLGSLRMSRLAFFVSAALFAGLLSGCNSAAPASPGPVAVSAPPRVKLPEGASCSAAIARYRAIQDNDLSMGHVNQSVYTQIQSEIRAAESACAAGQDGQALALIRASKARHGYPG
jgi:hypothetical protein